MTGVAVVALGELWLELLLAEAADAADGTDTGDVLCSPAALWLALAAREPGGARETASVDGVFTSTTDGPVNTVTVEASWERPFVPYFAREIPFTDAAGVTHPVPAMVAEVPVEDAWTVEGLSGRVTVVELRAGAASGGPWAKVRLALGEHPEVPLAEATAASWQPPGKRIRHRRGGGGRHPEAILLELPRLALSRELDVSAHLAALGDPGSVPQPTVQSCRLRLTEQGLTSAAPQEAAVDHPGPTQWTDGPGALTVTAPFRLDRPFALSVLDATGTIPLLAAHQTTRPGPGPGRSHS